MVVLQLSFVTWHLVSRASEQKMVTVSVPQLVLVQLLMRQMVSGGMCHTYMTSSRTQVVRQAQPTNSMARSKSCVRLVSRPNQRTQGQLPLCVAHDFSMSCCSCFWLGLPVRTDSLDVNIATTSPLFKLFFFFLSKPGSQPNLTLPCHLSPGLLSHVLSIIEQQVAFPLLATGLLWKLILLAALSISRAPSTTDTWALQQLGATGGARCAKLPSLPQTGLLVSCHLWMWQYFLPVLQSLEGSRMRQYGGTNRKNAWAICKTWSFHISPSLWSHMPRMFTRCITMPARLLEGQVLKIHD